MPYKNTHKIPTSESETVEFKTSFNAETVETLVAFANAKGGSVYIGVADDAKVVGVSLGKETAAGWVNEIKNKTAPCIIPDVEIIEKDTKTVVVLHVTEYPVKPLSYKGRYYKRTGNSNQLLSLSEVVNLHLQTINSSWDAYPDTVHSPDDISLNKVQAAIETMKSNGLTITETPMLFLQKYDLLREGKLTNAAYLLFKNKDSFTTTIELGRFQDAITIKDTARTKTDILTQIEQVLDFVRKHINKRVIITGEARNTQKWQYPLEAIREIVINMIIHRDYRAASDSVVKIFDNKIEFYNPGRLPEEISIENLLSNNYKSTPRNKLIADFCKDMRLIEKYGSGIGRIVDYFKRDGLPMPDFRNISEGFQVTVYGKEFDESSDGTPIDTSVDTPIITKGERKVLALIENDNFIKREEIAKLLGLSINTVKTVMSGLKKKGVLERVGNNKTGYWEIILIAASPQSSPQSSPQ
jgi:ATP-dependent DNA helicase RecG